MLNTPFSNYYVIFVSWLDSGWEEERNTDIFPKSSALLTTIFVSGIYKSGKFVSYYILLKQQPKGIHQTMKVKG